MHNKEPTCIRSRKGGEITKEKNLRSVKRGFELVDSRLDTLWRVVRVLVAQEVARASHTEKNPYVKLKKKRGKKPARREERI